MDIEKVLMKLADMEGEEFNECPLTKEEIVCLIENGNFAIRKYQGSKSTPETRIFNFPLSAVTLFIDEERFKPSTPLLYCGFRYKGKEYCIYIHLKMKQRNGKIHTMLVSDFEKTDAWQYVSVYVETYIPEYFLTSDIRDMSRILARLILEENYCENDELSEPNSMYDAETVHQYLVKIIRRQYDLL